MKTFIAILLLAATFIWAGSADYQDEIRMEEHYAEMVCAGHWPNYKNINNLECGV